MRWLKQFSPLITLSFLLLWCASATQAKDIRVGITEYQSVESAYEKYQTFFEELETVSQGSPNSEALTFRFAIGTYDEVIDWYNKGLIDIAVLSAMPMSDLLTSTGTDATQPEFKKMTDAYLGRVNPVGGRASEIKGCDCTRTLDDKQPNCLNGVETQSARSEYHTSCVVPAAYGWKSFDDVKKLAGQNQLKFLFVRPVSMSGYIVPEYFLKTFLKNEGIDLRNEEYDFTDQHTNTLQRMLRDPPDKSDVGKHVVGFVIDNTPYCVSKADAGKQGFTVLDTPTLTDIKIPHEAMLVNYNLIRSETDHTEYDDIKAKMKDLLAKRNKKLAKGEPILKNKPSTFTFTMQTDNKLHADDWRQDYVMANKIYETVKVPRSLQSGSSFDEFIESLSTYQHSAGHPAQLALVLSGGGAKCAYQAGAITEIENRLQDLRENPKYKGKYKDIDFGLVVGTSGGAINALLTALGGTKVPQTQKYINGMWQSFHQQEFFTPSPVFNLISGVCFGLLQALAITFAVLLFGRKRIHWKRIGQLLVVIELTEISVAIYLNSLKPWVALFVIAQVVLVFTVAGLIRLARRAAIAFLATKPGYWWSTLYRHKVGDWWRLAGWLILLISALEFIVARWRGPSLWPEELATNHLVQHLWMIILLISSVSYPWPMVLGLLMVASGVTGRLNIDWHGRRLWLIRGLTVLVVLVACVLVIDSLWKEPSPSNSLEIENAFIVRVPGMLAMLRHFPAGSGDGQAEKLRDISRRIVTDPSLLQRNLVITLSSLPLTDSVAEENDASKLNASQLPEDLYFFYQNTQLPWKPPPNEKRFIDFRDNPDKLLDVVIGSGTIYPLFPYRNLTDIKVKGKTVTRLKVIDGGFIHNSPIEAAVRWGATHIISIEASPLPRPFDPEDTFDNSRVAFNYIMAQTQRMDAVVRGDAEIFELRPRSDCDKKNQEPGTGCKESPEPNMDTFDFSPAIARQAFQQGQDDVNSTRALFKRVPGPPLFRKTALPVSEASLNRRH
ncbi:MAG: hypothetical protein QOF72_2770 [Blastocatellia bacterium]|nr:hypothetical protein [Blastocatellia bacterium]